MSSTCRDTNESYLSWNIDGNVYNILKCCYAPIINADQFPIFNTATLLTTCIRYWKETLHHVNLLSKDLEVVVPNCAKENPIIIENFLNKLGNDGKNAHNFITFLRQGTAHLEIAWREQRSLQWDGKMTEFANDLFFYMICAAFEMVMPDKPISDGTAFRYCMELIKNVGLYHLKEDNGEVYDYRTDRRKVLQLKPFKPENRITLIGKYSNREVLDEYEVDIVEVLWSGLKSVAEDPTDDTLLMKYECLMNLSQEYNDLINIVGNIKSSGTPSCDIYIIYKLVTYVDLLRRSLSEKDLQEVDEYNVLNENSLIRFWKNSYSKFDRSNNSTEFPYALHRIMSPQNLPKVLLDSIDRLYNPITSINENDQILFKWLAWYRWIMSDPNIPYSKLKHICVRFLEECMNIFKRDNERRKAPKFITEVWLHWYRLNRGGKGTIMELYDYCTTFLKSYAPEVSVGGN